MSPPQRGRPASRTTLFRVFLAFSNTQKKGLKKDVKGQKVAVTRKVVRGVRFFCHLTVDEFSILDYKARSFVVNLSPTLISVITFRISS